MADINLKNLARMTVSSTGAGTITLNAAVSGFLTFDLAGCSTASAGTIVRYAIADTTKSEIAFGTYRSSSLTLTRGSSTTGMKSTNSNSPIDMSNSAQVFITDADLDHPIRPDSGGTIGTLSLNMQYTGTSLFTAAATFSAAITYGGVTLSNSVTGTGSMVLSAGPSFTGTINAAGITATGDITCANLTTTSSVSGVTVTAAAALSGASVAGTMVGTQSDMETATDNAKLVTPGRAVYSPSAAKAWAKFDSAGTVLAGLNVSSVTDHGTGSWTVNFTDPFSTANYAAIFMLHNDVGALACPTIVAQSSASCRVTAVGVGGGTIDGTVSCVFFGDR